MTLRSPAAAAETFRGAAMVHCGAALHARSLHGTATPTGSAERSARFSRSLDGRTGRAWALRDVLDCYRGAFMLATARQWATGSRACSTGGMRTGPYVSLSCIYAASQRVVFVDIRRTAHGCSRRQGCSIRRVLPAPRPSAPHAQPTRRGHGGVVRATVAARPLGLAPTAAAGLRPPRTRPPLRHHRPLPPCVKDARRLPPLHPRRDLCIHAGQTPLAWGVHASPSIVPPAISDAAAPFP